MKSLLRCDESSAGAAPFDQDLWYNVAFCKKGVRLSLWRQILDCTPSLNIIKSKRCTKYNLAFCSRLVAKSRCTSVASRVQSESWCSVSNSFYQQMWDCIRVAQKYTWPLLCKSHRKHNILRMLLGSMGPQWKNSPRQPSLGPCIAASTWKQHKLKSQWWRIRHN